MIRAVVVFPDPDSPTIASEPCRLNREVEIAHRVDHVACPAEAPRS